MKTASNAELPSPAATRLDESRHSAKRDGGLWLWVAAAFCVLILAWAVFFKVAHSAKVETVPLATKGGRP